MLTDRERLDRQQRHPRLIELHRALSRLTSTLTVMNTGAHPDDEQSSMLAAMRFGAGMHVVILCSTRGEGGQNSLGPERTGALGVLRTRELEEAARQLDADIAWIGYGPEDPVHDFGFSKSGVDTLRHWGREIVIERMVRAYRTHRPDIVIPTFLDVPGQHGHHRAMTEAAEAAVGLAADPDAYPEHAREGLKPWRISKFYLPSWSGGGGTYDDEVPPPDVTATFTMPGRDEATGRSWTDLGEWSRAGHASQGMGHWRSEERHDWPLHLKIGPQGPETSPADNLPATLGEIGRRMGGPASESLAAAEKAIAGARAAFPRAEVIISALTTAAEHIETARSTLDDACKDVFDHRLARKLREIDAALLIAGGVSVTAWAEPAALNPGGAGVLNVHTAADPEVTIEVIASNGFTVGPPKADGSITTYSLHADAAADARNAFPPNYTHIDGNGPVFVRVHAQIGNRQVSVAVDLDETVAIVPAHSVSLEPNALILPTDKDPGTLAIKARVDGPNGHLTLDATDGIAARRTADGFDVVPDEIAPGRYRLAALMDGKPAFRQTPITYPHIGRTRYIEPEALQILALDLKLPADTTIGYVDGGSDRAGMWLRRMGLTVTDLAADDLTAGLDRFTTIVVGIFAFGMRPDLFAARTRINEWVENGGHLVTLYHRPADGWDPDNTPPRRVVIGSPSLRWRVTDAAAAVEILEPKHPLLVGPNPIGAEDFAGWDKERGLYFAADWDAAYSPLLAMNDNGEKPLKGALVTGSIGKGRHTHTSLVLHHQMDKLVPGAFRLMANLVQPAT